MVDTSKILRGIARVAGSVLFGLFLAALIGQMAFVQLTDANTLRPIIANTLAPQLASQVQLPADITQNYNQLLQACNQAQQLNISVPSQNFVILDETVSVSCVDVTTNNITSFGQVVLQRAIVSKCDRIGAATVPLQFGSFISNVKCSEVKTSTPDKMAGIIAAGGFDNIYNKQYPACAGLRGLTNCLMNIQSLPDDQKTFIISSQANSTVKNATNHIYLGLVAGLVLLIFSIRTWHKILRNVGITLLVAGVPYFFINSFKSLVPAGQFAQAISPILDSVFSSLSQYFLYAFVVGVVLTAAGFIGKYFFAKKEKPEKAAKKK